MRAGIVLASLRPHEDERIKKMIDRSCCYSADRRSVRNRIHNPTLDETAVLSTIVDSARSQSLHMI